MITHQHPISSFGDMPKSKLSKWAVGLSIASLLSGPILGVSAAIFVPFVQDKLGEVAATIFGSLLAMLVFGIFVLALFLSLRAFQSGDRSWPVWFALFLLCLVASFWILMFVGELVISH